MNKRMLMLIVALLWAGLQTIATGQTRTNVEQLLARYCQVIASKAARLQRLVEMLLHFGIMTTRFRFLDIDLVELPVSTTCRRIVCRDRT